jgi:hypothetical protein
MYFISLYVWKVVFVCINNNICVYENWLDVMIF